MNSRFQGSRGRPGWQKAWSELAPEQMKAAAVLGWAKDTWERNIPPSSSSRYWNQLTQEEQYAAAQLGYSAKMWDKDDDQAPIQNQYFPSAPSKMAQIAGKTASPSPTRRGNRSWDSLSPDEVQAAFVLGWSKETWDSNDAPRSNSLGWRQLSQAEQGAATCLGFTAQTWDKMGGGRVMNVSARLDVSRGMVSSLASQFSGNVPQRPVSPYESWGLSRSPAASAQQVAQQTSVNRSPTPTYIYR
jgi:hypothetical protein